jgi:hypothetical protein
MSEYEVDRYTIEPVEGDDQIALTIWGTDGNKWEYGIPFNRQSKRYTFEEVDVIANDFGEEFTDPLIEEIEALIDEICD